MTKNFLFFIKLRGMFKKFTNRNSDFGECFSAKIALKFSVKT